MLLKEGSSGNWILPDAANCERPVQVSPQAAAGASAEISSGAFPSSNILWSRLGAVTAATVLAWLSWLTFTRLMPAKVLNHPRRSRIYEFIRVEPGTGIYRTARSLGMPRSSLMHHLGHLRRGGQIILHRVGGRTALFPANAGFRGKEEAVAILRRRTLLRVQQLVAAKPGLHQAAIAQHLGLSQSAVSRSLKRLGTVGLLQAARQGRQLLYVPA